MEQKLWWLNSTSIHCNDIKGCIYTTDNEDENLVFLNKVVHLCRAGNLVGPSMGAEAISEVTSSGPVKLADLQRILNNIGSTGIFSLVLLVGHILFY